MLTEGFAFLTEENDFLTEGFAFLTERNDFLTEGFAFLTERFALLTEENTAQTLANADYVRLSGIFATSAAKSACANRLQMPAAAESAENIAFAAF